MRHAVWPKSTASPGVDDVTLCDGVITNRTTPPGAIDALVGMYAVPPLLTVIVAAGAGGHDTDWTVLPEGESFLVLLSLPQAATTSSARARRCMALTISRVSPPG